MNIKKSKSLAGICCCLLLAFSASADIELDSGVTIEKWLPQNGQEIPVLTLGDSYDDGELADDIRIENITQDQDHSTRYQLSHSGPLSRQVFASVNMTEQEDGYTRNIITNIADGRQIVFLSPTVELPPTIQQGKRSGVDFSVGIEKSDDNNTECATCIVALALGAACIVSEHKAFNQCKSNCQHQGGIKNFDSGFCGAIETECICKGGHREIAIEY